MSGEQYKFKGRGTGHKDGNRAGRLDRVRIAHQPNPGRAETRGASLGRIVATFSGVKIKEISADLRGIRKVHPEAKDKDTILPFVAEGSRVLYGRAIDVMLQIAREGMILYDLSEATVWEETLPDGTKRDLAPECKYRKSSMPYVR